MQQLLIYILKVVTISGLLLLYYYFGLRNKRFHYYNRFYLLCTVLISALLPLLHLQWFSFSGKSTGTIKLYRIMYGGYNEDVLIRSGTHFTWQQLMPVLFIATGLLMLTQLILSIIKIYRLKKVYPVHKLNEFDFINTNLQSAPFSFFKNIFWRNDIEPDTNCGQQILQHEITHIEQRHSLDKIFMQLVLCFYWINPFFWWLKKELYLIHEFIADEKAVNNNDAASFAQMLLTARFGKFEYLPAQSIFYSSIKRRLLMLTASKKTQFSYLRRIMVLPLIASVVCLFAFTVNNQNKNVSVQKIIALKPFVLVVDAGHGGKDDGAVNNDILEKDLNLKIAEKIKELSPQYNINVVLTRDNDVFMSPPQKANFANAQNADAFISIHVNASPNNLPPKSGMEVLLSKRNENILNNSQILGSAIIQNLQTNFNVLPALLQQQVGIWVLDQSKIPSALIECGYITNANDIKLLKDNSKVELMARNILQGVAAYANNSFDRSNLYKIKDRDYDTSAPAQANTTLQKQPEPLYVVDGKIISKAVFDKQTLEPNNILSINVLKGKEATDKYRDEGKNGVIEVTLKTANKNSKKTLAPPPPPPSPLKAPPSLKRDTSQSTSSVQESKPIFTKAQQEPQFPGGIEGWKKYLENNLNADVPSKNHGPKGIYTVTVSFLVDENGKVLDVKALTNPGYGTAEEAERVIAAGPNWQPAVQNMHKVTFEEKQNIIFSVN